MIKFPNSPYVGQAVQEGAKRWVCSGFSADGMAIWDITSVPGGEFGGSGDTGNLFPFGYIDKLWTFQNATKAPCYSSPVGPVLLGPSNDIPCVVFCAGDRGTYALKIADGTPLWRAENVDECYGRCQWATIAGDNFVFSPCHAGGIAKYDRNGVKVASHPSIYDDPNRSQGSVTAVVVIDPTTYEITSNKANWVVGNMFQRPDAAYNAGITFTPGSTGTILQVVAPDKLRITSPNPPPAIGSTYVVNERYWSDRIFMHAGTLNVEAGIPYLYATSFDNCVRKINAVDFSEVWIKASLENIEPYPLLLKVGGILRCFVVSIDSNLYCLDATTGAVVWGTNCAPETNSGVDSFLNACDITDNGELRICVSSRDGRVYTVNAATGVMENRSTNTQSWQFNEINSSAIPVKISGEFNIVTGGDSGTVWRFNSHLETVWANFEVPNSINSSSVVHDLAGDGNLCQLVGDMRGTIHITRIVDGVKIGSIYFKGGVEGVPYCGDIDDDGKVELIVTTTDGFVEMFRFVIGDVTDDTGIFPGLTRSTGGITKVE